MRAMATVWCGLLLGVVAAACVSPVPQQIGGTVQGLASSGTLILVNNGTDPITITRNGNFNFTIPVSNYNVTVQAQPAGQTCNVTNGSGTVNGMSITNVNVVCGNSVTGPFSIGGTVSGLTSGSITLTLNGANPLTINTNGSFAFTQLLSLGQTYTVAVAPGSGLQCALTNATGSVGANVTNVGVTCTQTMYTLAGSVSGLSGSVTLTNTSNGDIYTVTSPNNTFSFPTQLPTGQPWSISVSQNPVNQQCIVSPAQGTAGNANNSHAIAVTCNQALRAISVVVTGLTGVVQVALNGSDVMNIAANGTFTFDQKIPDSSIFNVTVVSEPNNQACVIPNGVGNVFGTDITNILVNCSTPQFVYSIAGIASGLQGNVTLSNAYVDTLVVPHDGAFTFATSMYRGSNFNVFITKEPTGQACTMQMLNGTTITQGGFGPVGNANVTSLRLACGPGYTIGGSVTGLATGGAPLILLNNNGDPLTVTADTAFVFATPLATNASYSVTVLSSPTNQTCTVSSGLGTVASSNINNVTVNCVSSATSAFTIGGTVSGLSGTLKLANYPGTDTATLSTSGTFAFTTPISNLAPYNVQVTQQPSGQVCLASDNVGVVSDQNVTSISIVCKAGQNIVLPVSGLSGGNLVIQTTLTPGYDTIITGNGNTTLQPAVLTSTLATVSVAASPPHLKCVVVNPTGDFQDGSLAPQVVCGPYHGFVSGQNANSVVGQNGFYTGTCNLSSMTPSASSLCYPYGDPYVDSSGRLYISDFGNSRALVYATIPPGGSATASNVMGQTSFTATTTAASATGLNHPSGATGGGTQVAVVDKFNSRVLLYNTPVSNGPTATVVVGQANLTNASSACSSTGLNNPSNAIIVGGKLLVADTGNNRVLIWNTVPTSNGTAASYVLGQTNLTTCTPSSPLSLSGANLNQPGDAWSDGTNVIVADTDNNRVLIFSNFFGNPASGATADGVLGQQGLTSALVSSTMTGMQLPASVTANTMQLFVGDTGNNRVLIFNSLPLLYAYKTTVSLGPSADVELGQIGFGQSTDLASCNGQANAINLPNQAGPATMCTPSGLQAVGGALLVTDSSNSRVLVYQGF